MERCPVCFHELTSRIVRHVTNLDLLRSPEENVGYVYGCLCAFPQTLRSRGLISMSRSKEVAVQFKIAVHRVFGIRPITARWRDKESHEFYFVCDLNSVCVARLLSLTSWNKVPKKLMAAKKDAKLGFLKGFFDHSGWLGEDKIKPDLRLHFYSLNRQILVSLFCILTEFQMTDGFKFDKYQSNPRYYLGTNDPVGIQKYKSAIGFTRIQDREMVNRYLGDLRVEPAEYTEKERIGLV